jgi:hypothetical protein
MRRLGGAPDVLRRVHDRQAANVVEKPPIDKIDRLRKRSVPSNRRPTSHDVTFTHHPLVPHTSVCRGRKADR